MSVLFLNCCIRSPFFSFSIFYFPSVSPPAVCVCSIFQTYHPLRIYLCFFSPCFSFLSRVRAPCLSSGGTVSVCSPLCVADCLGLTTQAYWWGQLPPTPTHLPPPQTGGGGHRPTRSERPLFTGNCPVFGLLSSTRALFFPFTSGAYRCLPR